nr:hypothetical protein [uncultured Prevotella sp.]
MSKKNDKEDNGCPINEKLMEKYDEYCAFMDNPKYIESPIVIKERRSEHPTSLEYVRELQCSNEFGNSKLSIEIKNENPKEFSAKIMTDVEGVAMLLRYDSSGKTHRNKLDDIPLAEQMIPTPHLHYYDKFGHFLAKQTDEMAEENACKIEFGFPIFCKAGKIYGEKSLVSPRVQIGLEASIPFDSYSSDPCEGVKF